MTDGPQHRMGDSIGIVIPVFNRPRQIVRALESVLAQTLPPWQVVVVDDGSTDGTAAAAERWAAGLAPPFRLTIVRQTNQGAAAARNAGFAVLEGCPLVLFLDSDDRLPPDLLARGAAALAARADAVLAMADILQITEADRAIRIFHVADEVISHPLRHMFALGSAFLSSSLMRAEPARRAGLFPANFPTGQDTVFLCRLAQLGPWLALPGAPVRQAHYLPVAGEEAGHLSQRFPDRFNRWARMHEAIFREARPGLSAADRYVLRRSIGGRFFNAAQAAMRRRRRGEAAGHMLRAGYHLAVAYLEPLGGGAERSGR